MNFNYSYRAFLISSLLFGALFLFILNFNLTSNRTKAEVRYSVEYTELEEEEAADIEPADLVKVETNRAFNEAEKFIEDIESQRNDLDETTETKLAEIDQAIDNTVSDKKTIARAKRKIAETKLINGLEKANEVTESNSANKNTTISYRLVDRKSLYLPNPVYTCDGGGRVVVNVEVSNTGKVIKANFNKTGSGTSNECLIDSALKYAYRARFTTAANKNRQLGSITYNFPGQK